MPIPVTRQLVEHAAAELAEGGWQFTPRQLYYATCAQAESPRTNAAANGEIGLGVLLVLVGLIFIRVEAVFVALGTLGAVLVLAGIIARLRRPPLTGRVLALSFVEFRNRFSDLNHPLVIDVERWVLDPDQPTQTGPAVVCDTRETAVMIIANRTEAGLGDLGVYVQHAIPADLGSRRVAVIHDASPSGCAVLLDLRDAGIHAIDAGLRPSRVDSLSHQVLEGAPARLPRDLDGALEPDEIHWLMSGRRVELATLGPGAAMRLLQVALAKDPEEGGRPDAPRVAHPG